MADRTGDLFIHIFRYAWETDHLGHGTVSDSEQFVRTEKDERDRLIRNRVNRIIDGKIVFPGNGPDDVEFFRLPDFAQGDDASIGDGNAPVRNDGIRIDVHNLAQALAVRAVAFR